MNEKKILGINRRSYPVVGQAGAFDRIEISVVLVAGAVGDYAAYVGSGLPQDIARHGDKVSFAEACIHFPGEQLEEARYRV